MGGDAPVATQTWEEIAKHITGPTGASRMDIPLDGGLGDLEGEPSNPLYGVDLFAVCNNDEVSTPCL